MIIRFHGVRGSYPVPGEEFSKFGGNTTCVSFTKKIDGMIQRIVIDSGTGIIGLGKQIIKNYFEKQEGMSIHLFFTHLHPDHTQGFPFFGPNYFKNSEIHLYGMQALDRNIEQVLAAQMTPPNFPIEYRSMKSNRTLHVIEDGSIIDLLAFKVKVMQAYAPSHPQQGALYFRVFDKETGKNVACIWDNESKVGGDKAVIKFIEGADLVIHDTQYTTEEYESSSMIVQGFGHSTYDMALDNVRQAKAKKLVCVHYNPTHTDDILHAIQTHYLPYGVSKEFGDIPVLLAKEGMDIEV